MIYHYLYIKRRVLSYTDPSRFANTKE